MEVQEKETPASIESFIRHSQELTPLLSHDSENGGGWDDDIPPGQELQDYGRDPNVAIPLPPPPPPLFQDPGRTPNALLERQPPSPKDVEDASATRGVCGLLNMGNTCYMNAGLQCIRNIPDIAKYYLDSKFSEMQLSSCTAGDSEADKFLACKGHLSARFSTLVQKLWSSRFSALHPKAFKTTLGLLHPQFGDNRQQDCQEFLAMLLDTLHEDALPSQHGHTSKLRNSDCNHEEKREAMEEDVPSNRIAVADESHDPENPAPSAQCHDERKPSVVTETFQGMLRNEVVCNTCHHLSTKVEPFIYLSVPLPHAYERQIEIHWAPLCTRQGERVVTKLLVTVLRDVSVGEVKDALLLLIGRQLSHDLVLAEVKEKSIVRVLSDSFSLKQLDDGGSEIYVFEMAPVEGVGCVELVQVENSQPATPEQMGYQRLGDGTGPVPSPTVPETQEPNRDPWMPVTGHTPSHTPARETSELDPFGSEHFLGSGNGVAPHGVKHGKESDSEGEVIPAKMMRREETPVEPRLSASPTREAPDAMDCGTAHGNGPSENTGSNVGSAPAVSSDNDFQSPVRAVVMEWHSCSICLEEMVDSDLLIHRDCGAIVCPTCLQASSEHYSQGGALMPCPICSTMVSPSQAFHPLATLEESHVIRLLQTNIMFRREAYDGSTELFGHPALLNLPSDDRSTVFYSTISALLASPTVGHEWKLCLTDAKGRFCSRCLFGSGCRGCVIADCDVPLQLKPGDHIAVTFPLLSSITTEMASRVVAHPSLKQRREQQLSLEECLQAFSQRELLGADNPWLCPHCGQAREAMRTLAVCTLPRTLIVHLKRFIFHGSSSSKVDAPVSFPHRLDPCVVGGATGEEGPLELAAFVCHFGTLHSGHYTAYSRHPSSGEWWCYNDETATKGEPTEKEMEKAYILFYQQQASTPPTLPEVTASFDDPAEMRGVDQLLRLFKPHPSPASEAPPPLPPKRASSESDLVGGSGESAHNSAIISALGLEPPSLLTDSSAPTLPPPLTRASSNPQLTSSTAAQFNVGHKGSLLEDYRNYDFSPEIDDPVSSATGGVQLLSVKMKSW